MAAHEPAQWVVPLSLKVMKRRRHVGPIALVIGNTAPSCGRAWGSPDQVTGSLRPPTAELSGEASRSEESRVDRVRDGLC